MRAVICAGSPVCYNEGLIKAVRGCGVFICADYGIRRAIEIGIAPGFAVGDFDSALSEDLEALTASPFFKDTKIERLQAEKDETDLEVCINLCARLGANDLDVFGCTGGRADHAFAAVQSLRYAESLNINARIIDGTAVISLVSKNNPQTIEGAIGGTVTLLPLTEQVSGIKTKGLKYPLNGETLIQGRSRGVSNIITNPPAAVSAESGALAVFLVSGL